MGGTPVRIEGLRMAVRGEAGHECADERTSGRAEERTRMAMVMAMAMAM